MGEVAEFRRGTAFTAKQARGGPYPVVANGPTPIAFHDESNRDGEFVVVARSGAYAGTVSLWEGPIFLTDAFSIHPNPSELSTRFTYYLLRSIQDELYAKKAGGGVPHVRVREIEAYEVAIPPLDEQDQVVSMLDEFDALVNDISIGLPAELAARRKQYEYYRDKLLTFEEAS